MKKTSKQVLQEAQDTLFTAELGLELMRGNKPKERIAGLRNLIVFGRAITNVLQNLRSTEPTFDEWYLPKQFDMRKDPILKYLYNLRSQILKEGTIDTTSSLHLSGDPSALMRQFTAPRGAKGFFMGDRIGGCGWEVEIEEGVTEKFYIAVPGNIEGLDLNIQVHLKDVPEEFPDMNIVSLGEYYISYLSNLIDEAKSIFVR